MKTINNVIQLCLSSSLGGVKGCFILFTLGFTATAQELTKPEDFDLPANTEMALEITGSYSGDKQIFSQTGGEEYRFNSEGKLAQLKKMITNNMATQDVYHYNADGQLTKIDYIFGTKDGGMSSSSTTFSVEKKDKEITYKRRADKGYTARTVAYYNAAGELQSKNFYDAKVEPWKKIEYNGTKEYRVKEFKDNKIVSDIIYQNNDQGKLVKQLKFTQPMERKSKEELTTYSYNDKGDLETKLVHYDNQQGETPKVMDLHVTEYLYDGDIWVARVAYRHLYYSDPSWVEVTIRRIKTADKMYSAKDEKAILDFCKQVYQHYVATKKQAQPPKNEYNEPEK